MFEHPIEHPLIELIWIIVVCLGAAFLILFFGIIVTLFALVYLG